MQEVRNALNKSAKEIVAAQKAAVRVKSGKLRDSIVWQPSDAARIKYSQGGGSKSVSAPGSIGVRISAGNSRVRYAHLVEFGTASHPQGGSFKGTQHPGTPPSPFFYPVYRARKRAVKARVKRAIKKAVSLSR
jgi:HK97 gp10 family phage protein